jgi:hypothetical protein
LTFGKRRGKRQKNMRGIIISNRLIFDSDDGDINLNNEFDKWHQAKREFALQMLRMTNLPEVMLLGLGIPQRTPSYLGVNKKCFNEEEYNRKNKDQ